MDNSIEHLLESEIKLRFKTIYHMSEKTGIPYMTISNVLKRGVFNTTLGTLEKICNALDFNVSSLLERYYMLIIMDKINTLGDTYSNKDLAADLKKYYLYDLHINKNSNIDEQLNNLRIFFSNNFL